MIQIRYSVFETNSSSVHSLTFISDADFAGFLSGDLVFDRWGDRMVPLSSMEEIYDPSDYGRRYWKKEDLYDLGYYYGGEAFVSTKTLPDGHRCNYICYYGHD